MSARWIMRYVFGFVCVCALSVLPLVGCGDNNGGGGSGGTAGTGGTGGMSECQNPEDCDDGNECTTKWCDSRNGTCQYGDIPPSWPCEGNNVCDGSGNCVGCYEDENCVVDCTVGRSCNLANSTCVGGEDAPKDTPCSNGVCDDAGKCVDCNEVEQCEDDLNDCTTTACEDNTCADTAVANGAPCAGGTCQAGACELSGLVLPCTEQGIRNAVVAGGGPYRFDCDGPTTVTTGAEIHIYNNVILDGEGNLTVNGNDVGCVFCVGGRATAELHGLTVIGGRSAAVSNGGQTLSLTNTTVSGNLTGIENLLGTMTVTNSTVSGHWQGIRNFEGTMTVTNCTVSGDNAIVNALDATMTVTNCTVSGDIHALTSVLTTSAIEMTATLFEGACTQEGDEVTWTSNGYNIESPGNTCGFDQLTDLVDVTADDLKLGPLQDNGGPTETQALGAGSVAIDRILEADCVDAEGAPLTTDQRGEPRPAGAESKCDVGAFEVQP